MNKSQRPLRTCKRITTQIAPADWQLIQTGNLLLQ